MPLNVALRASQWIWHSAHATQCGILRVPLDVAFCTCHSMWPSARATQCGILHMPLYVPLTVAFRTCPWGILTVTRHGIMHMPLNVAFCTCPQCGILYMPLNVTFCTFHVMWHSARHVMWHSKCRNWCHYTITDFRNKQQKLTARWTCLSTAHQLLWNRNKVTSPICFCGNVESTLVLRAQFPTQGVPNQVSKLS